MTLTKDNTVWDFLNLARFSLVNKITLMTKCSVKIVTKDYLSLAVIQAGK